MSIYDEEKESLYLVSSNYEQEDSIYDEKIGKILMKF